MDVLLVNQGLWAHKLDNGVVYLCSYINVRAEFVVVGDHIAIRQVDIGRSALVTL